MFLHLNRHLWKYLSATSYGFKWILTAAFTVVANSTNSGEDLFRSCEVKLLCNLNPKLTFEFAEGAAVVVPSGWTGDEAVLAGANVTLAGGEVTVAGSEVALAGINISKVYEIWREKQSKKQLEYTEYFKWKLNPCVILGKEQFTFFCCIPVTVIKGTAVVVASVGKPTTTNKFITIKLDFSADYNWITELVILNSDWMK